MGIKNNRVLVEQFKNDDFLNVRVNRNGHIKSEENIELPDAYILINEYIKKHNITLIEFVLYNGEPGVPGEEIYRREISARI